MVLACGHAMLEEAFSKATAISSVVDGLWVAAIFKETREEIDSESGKEIGGVVDGHIELLLGCVK